MDRIEVGPPEGVLWWVVFKDVEPIERRWWHLFTRPGFRHCYAFRQIYDDVLIIINPLQHHIEHQVIFCTPVDYVKTLLKAGCRVLVVEPQKPPYTPRRGLIMTCASILGYLMGLDSRAITPYGLHNLLIERYHAEDLTHERIIWGRQAGHVGDRQGAR